MSDIEARCATGAGRLALRRDGPRRRWLEHARRDGQRRRRRRPGRGDRRERRRAAASTRRSTSCSSASPRNRSCARSTCPWSAATSPSTSTRSGAASRRRTGRSGAYHRGPCASTSSPAPRSRSGSTSCGRSPSASSGMGWPGSGGAPRGSATTAGCTATERPCAFRDDPDGVDRVGAQETTAVLVHLRRPSRLSTLDLPDAQPFDDPAGRFSFSHNGDFRDWRGARADYADAGRIHGRADTEVGARWLEDAWRDDRSDRRAPGRPARSVRRPGEPRAARARWQHAPLRRQYREPGVRVPARADRPRLDGDLLARSIALRVRRAGRDRPPSRARRQDLQRRP